LVAGIKKSPHPKEARSAVSKDAQCLSTVPDGEPLRLHELDAAFAAIGGFEPRPLIAVGVSGGPDSLALMILADRWARERGGEAWGLIVDHRLRPESASEAAIVAGWLAARGIPNAILVWEGEKPATGIQEAARAARYRLLTGWCAAHGCLHLLTAHHRDDQIETYLIRRRAASGVDGLAGMAVVRELQQQRLVRPLLGVPKARLLAFLEAEGQPYVRDPSNRNPVFERVRLRLEIESAPAPHPRPLPARGEREAPIAPIVQRWEGEGQVLHELRRNAAIRIARDRELSALLARSVSLHLAGFAMLDPSPIAASGELGERALDRVIAVLSGTAYPVRRERLRRLREALADGSARPRTLGGCRFVPWRGRVLALREAARTGPPLLLEPGRVGMWDQRFAASMPAAAPMPVSIKALGSEGVAALRGEDMTDDNPLPRLVYPVLPAVWDSEGLAAVPHLLWRRATFACPPVLAFRPLVSLFGAGFTVV
jgi:tRNA(Ile)-lysidine synthase